ncbi:uroporphyrinogen-III synthase [Staphylococcus sp. H16/1A]|uniref:Uroporphyrinogen-III synthase n=2 Tax=Staphylococcus canis TaxID=2724942 RepID=A0ABS0T633_9STAP|nr:uroporphyrinogen-III synthase [Staphylococcus canis]
MTQTHDYENTLVNIYHLPLIRTQKLMFDTQQLKVHYHWLLFSSKNAVRYFLPYIEQTSFDKVAVIGKKTEAYCIEHGINVDFTPDLYSQEGFLDAFHNECSTSILIPSSQGARPLLHETLRHQGHKVCKIDLYRSIPYLKNIKKAHQLVDEKKIDYITFASSSAVRAFFDDSYELNSDIGVVTIGAQTQQTANQYGIDNISANIQTLDAMIKKIIETRE